MVIYGRDARIGPRSLKNLFTGKSGTTNRCSAVYELAMKSANKAGSPGMYYENNILTSNFFRLH